MSALQSDVHAYDPPQLIQQSVGYSRVGKKRRHLYTEDLKVQYLNKENHLRDKLSFSKWKSFSDSLEKFYFWNRTIHASEF